MSWRKTLIFRLVMAVPTFALVVIPLGIIILSGNRNYFWMGMLFALPFHLVPNLIITYVLIRDGSNKRVELLLFFATFILWGIFCYYKLNTQL